MPVFSVEPDVYRLRGASVQRRCSGAGVVNTPAAAATTTATGSTVDLLSPSRKHHPIIWPKKYATEHQNIKGCRRHHKRTSPAMTTEDNGNVGLLKPTSSSNEDLSEYTDADESISAPTEILAEFLSAVMMKDYVTALKYCKLILQYEPNNATAKEFYPLILEKMQQTINATEDASSNDSDEEEASEENSSSSSSSDSDSSSSSEDNSSEGQEEEEEEEVEVGRGDKQSKGSSDGDATTGSYSSLEDDEAETDHLAALAAKYQVDNVDLGNGNKIYGTPFEEPLANLPPPFGTSSDSESPTEPVSQQTVQLLRARVVPNKQ